MWKLYLRYAQSRYWGVWGVEWQCLFLWNSNNIYEFWISQFFSLHKVFSTGRKMVCSNSERKWCDVASVLTLFFFPSSLGFLELGIQKIAVLWITNSPETWKQWDKVSETSCRWQCSIKWKKQKKKKEKNPKRHWKKVTQKIYSYSWIICVIVFHMQNFSKDLCD